MAEAAASRSPLRTDPLSAPDVTARLVDCWRTLLSNDALGENDDFFAAGGGSLTAVRLRSMVRAEMGRDLEIVDVFEYPTPSGLTSVVLAAPSWPPD